MYAMFEMFCQKFVVATANWSLLVVSILQVSNEKRGSAQDLKLIGKWNEKRGSAWDLKLLGKGDKNLDRFRPSQQEVILHSYLRIVSSGCCIDQTIELWICLCRAPCSLYIGFGVGLQREKPSGTRHGFPYLLHNYIVLRLWAIL